MNKYQIALKHNVDLIELENKAKDEFEFADFLRKARQQEFIKRDVFNQINEKKWSKWFLK